MQSVIEQIQKDDPSYNPLTMALRAAGTTQSLWKAATDRIYLDGFYGPINASEWKEQDGRKPYYLSSAIKIVARVLDKVDDYRIWDTWYFDKEDHAECDKYYEQHEHEFIVQTIPASEIRAALIPWYKEIYGERYPRL